MTSTAIRRQSRKERRRNNQDQGNSRQAPNFELMEVKPKTDNQRIAFDAYDRGKNLMLNGIAGTGKTFLSMYLSLLDVLDANTDYEKLYIIRSVVPTRDMGFLPGNNKEKTKVYEAPYYAICTELFDRSDAYEYLKSKGLVEFISTSFVRGITLSNCVVIVDEMQNLTLHESDSVITRVGHNCKIIFSGDYTQSDFIYDRDKNGINEFIRIIKKIKQFEFITFTKEDILRSDLVKDYIIEKDKLGIIT